MTDKRTELTPIIAECLIDMGLGSYILDGIELASLLELIREYSLDNGL